MKICAKCRTEYPDDMAFCTRCGTTLQSKERICPACGKVLGKDTQQFCPYCGNHLDAKKTNTPDSEENVCPACRHVIYAKNLSKCPYCNHRFDTPITNKVTNVSNKPPLPEVNIKKNYVKMQPLNREEQPTTTPFQSGAQRNECPSCHSVIYAKNIKTCPYCGVSLIEKKSNANNQPSSNANRPLPPEVNIKKNYVKMRPLNSSNDENVTVNKPIDNKTHVNVNKPVSTIVTKESHSDDSERSPGGCLKSALSIIGMLFLVAVSKSCGKVLYHGTTSQQKGIFIGIVIAGIVGSIIPAFVAYKCCKFDNPFNAAMVVVIVEFIVTILSFNGIIPIGSIPIGIILAILLYLFNKK